MSLHSDLAFRYLQCKYFKIKNGIWDAGIVLKMQGSSQEMKHLLSLDSILSNWVEL